MTPSSTQVQKRALDSLGCSQDLKQCVTAYNDDQNPKKAKEGRKCKENLGRGFRRSERLHGESNQCWEAEVYLAINLKVIYLCKKYLPRLSEEIRYSFLRIPQELSPV